MTRRIQVFGDWADLGGIQGMGLLRAEQIQTSTPTPGTCSANARSTP